MIEVEDLEKSYGFARALKGVSFSVQKGEVVGFLGPNGAGKSTTMKILTGYLAPTAGRGAIDGHDVVVDSLRVRERVGYLPESTPLYAEMRVDDYLGFVAEIRGVAARDRRAKIARAVELCGLQRVTGKNIVELSKGYKQRVGLAQAIVHEPPVLILDEPTSGLDPNQIVEVRNLIERLGEEHTVVLSTHYLQEVEKSCTRVIIVNQGEIVADGTQAELVATRPAGRLTLRVCGPEAEVLAQLRAVAEGEGAVTVEGRAAGYVDYCVRPDDADEPLEQALARGVVERGWDLLSLQREQPSLEDVFRELTLRAPEEVTRG
jgi:ABC-2 type transport system ATP-binding protein